MDFLNDVSMGGSRDHDYVSARSPAVTIDLHFGTVRLLVRYLGSLEVIDLDAL